MCCFSVDEAMLLLGNSSTSREMYNSIVLALILHLTLSLLLLSLHLIVAAAHCSLTLKAHMEGLCGFTP